METFFKSDMPSRLDLKRQQKACVMCGADVRSKSPLQRTCSMQCGYAWRKSKSHHHRTCRECGHQYQDVARQRTRYCSRTCYRTAVGRRFAMVSATCEHCGGQFTRTQAALKRVSHSFCGNACRQSFFVGENSPNFRGAKDPNRGVEWNKLAAAIRARDCFTCRRCGLCEYGNGTKGERLSVDHVRPWRSFEDKAKANHPDNLVSLCRRCHSHKTSYVERMWLKGDVMAYLAWVRSLHLKSAVKGISVHQELNGAWVVHKQFNLVDLEKD